MNPLDIIHFPQPTVPGPVHPAEQHRPTDASRADIGDYLRASFNIYAEVRSILAGSGSAG